VSYLSLVGGPTGEKNTRKILKTLFDGGLRKEINFTGRGNKTAFKDLKLYNVLKGNQIIGKTLIFCCEILYAN